MEEKTNQESPTELPEPDEVKHPPQTSYQPPKLLASTDVKVRRFLLSLAREPRELLPEPTFLPKKCPRCSSALPLQEMLAHLRVEHDELAARIVELASNYVTRRFLMAKQKRAMAVTISMYRDVRACLWGLGGEKIGDMVAVRTLEYARRRATKLDWYRKIRRVRRLQQNGVIGDHVALRATLNLLRKPHGKRPDDKLIELIQLQAADEAGLLVNTEQVLRRLFVSDRMWDLMRDVGSPAYRYLNSAQAREYRAWLKGPGREYLVEFAKWAVSLPKPTKRYNHVGVYRTPEEKFFDRVCRQRQLLRNYLSLREEILRTCRALVEQNARLIPLSWLAKETGLRSVWVLEFNLSEISRACQLPVTVLATSLPNERGTRFSQLTRIIALGDPDKKRDYDIISWRGNPWIENVASEDLARLHLLDLHERRRVQLEDAYRELPRRARVLLKQASTELGRVIKEPLWKDEDLRSDQ